MPFQQAEIVVEAMAKDEAPMLLMVAEGHLVEEQDEDALKAASDALSIFRAQGEKSGIADAVRVVTQCYCLQERPEKASEMARQELTKFKQMGDDTGVGKMLLSIAEADGDVQAANDALAALAGDDKLTAKANLALAFAYIKKKDGDKSQEVGAAERAAMDALESYKKRDDRRGEAKALHCLAAVHAADGKLADAIKTEEQALEIVQDLGLAKLEAFEYYSIALLYLEKNTSRKALYYAQEALELYRESGGGPKEFKALGVVVKSYIAKGQQREALQEANAGLQRAQETANSRGEADSWMLSYLAYQANDEMDQALTSLERAIETYRQGEDSDNECKLLCMASEMHLSQGSYMKSSDESLRAIELVKATRNWTQMASAVRCYVNAKIQMGEAKDAVNVAIDAREVFEKAAAPTAEASACLSLCEAHRANKKFDRAATAAKAAQEIAYQAEDEKGEAHALSVMADVYMSDDKFDKAVRAAEQARRLWKGLENPSAEANALNIIAQAHVNMQHKKESMDSKGMSGPGKDGWDKALKTATEAAKISRELPDEEGGKLFTATALCTLAEVFLSKKSGDDALTNANEAVALFMEGNDEASAAHAWVLCAQADILMEDFTQARDDAAEGLEIFKTRADDRGQGYAQSVMDLIDRLAPAPPPGAGFDPAMMAQMMAQMGGGGGGAPQWKVPPSGQSQPQMAQMAPAPGQAIVPKTGMAGKLDISAGITFEIVSAKIKEVAMGIIGDDEDIEVDMPLMQAGLTSNTAVLLRDEMSTTIPGVNLPPTLMFDYPSIQAIADYIVEKAAGK